ncbi:MAG TPA: ATP-binding protein [Mariprofundaceae bacterium]|nr:ATP-binding protein [Mariprofundaceae bacterium]
MNEATLSGAETLHILLQTSALFLVGGVMAAIARRYASLQQESHQAVRQHRQLKELYAQVVSSMQEGIIILDEALHVQDSNQPAYQLLGIDGEPPWFQLSDIGNVPDALIDFLKRVDTSLFQCEWKTASGSCLTTVAPLQGDDPAARWLLTIVDITDVRTLERRLAEQDKLASMGRMVAMLAHEIRNPLQTIGQSVELMGSVREARQADIQRIVTEEIQRLNRLVSDMLDYVQPLTPTSVEVTCSDLIGSSVVQVDMQGTLEISWSSDIDSLMIDPDHFRLMLDNLLRNAVEASPQPKTVKIRLQGNNNDWQLTISDQGGGISEEMKGHLFEPFSTGRESGVGLGLATVWQVCQVNGWKVEVEDIPGGSCFMVRGNVASNQTEEILHG